jgi:Zn-dependent M28 family amino/carboxypeptidase
MSAGRCRRRTRQERPCTLSDLNGSEDKTCGEAIASLTSVVTQLGTNIGARNISHYMALAMAADYIEGRFAEIGYSPVRQSYEARQKGFHNIVAERLGTKCAAEIVVVGAHYDSHKDSPGANDNGSAVAVLLELARLTSDPHRTVRFVAFTNEETPFTRTANMGSYVYAKLCREKSENIVGMLCLETLGCFSEEVGSQWLSLRGLLLPRRGNFLALIGDRKSRPLLHQVSAVLSKVSAVRFRALTLPQQLPGARSSDHWSFWKNGFPAIMATDTAPLRYRHYHTLQDTPDKINFLWLGRVVSALDAAVRNLGDN